MILADSPLLVLLVLAIGLPLAAEVGSRINPGAVDDPPSSQISGAAMGLLALLIAFTFGMAVQRFDARRTAGVAEANAISTAYLRYQLLDEPLRGALEADMAPYAATRLAFAAASVDSLKLSRNRNATSALQARIWNDVGRAVRTPQGQIMVVPLLTATNEMFDLATARHAATQARVPGGVRWALVVFAIMAATSVGWSQGEAWGRRRIAGSLLFLLVALAIALIADLDQPGGGIIRAPQSTMQYTVDQILRAHTATVRGPGAPPIGP